MTSQSQLSGHLSGITAPQGIWGWADNSWPFSKPQRSMRPPPSTEKPFFPTATRTRERKWTCETVNHFLFIRGWDFVFLKTLVLSAFSKQPTGVSCSESPQMPSHRGALGCPMQRRKMCFLADPPPPQAFHELQIITPSHLCRPQLRSCQAGLILGWWFSQVRPGCHPRLPLLHNPIQLTLAPR